MQAVILAAGMGRRLKKLTENNTKCMISVNGVTLIERMLRILDRKGLERIVIVSGYAAENLESFVDSLHIETPVCFIRNSLYEKTNNIYSLLLAKKYICDQDTLILESDLIFDEELIDMIIEDPGQNLVLVDKFAAWMNGTCMELDSKDRIKDLIPGKHLRFSDRERYFKTVNIYKFSRHFSENIYIPFLEAYFKAMGVNEYYESVIKFIALLDGSDIRAKRLNGQKWYEIDDEQDLDIAKTLFSSKDGKAYDLYSARYGGFWRFPGLLDYCYLVNPYFPFEKMVEEMQASFHGLLSRYPSGHGVIDTLAAGVFNVDREHIVCGNGASELISSLMDLINGHTLGMICPAFEEYRNRYDGKILALDTMAEDTEYCNIDSIMKYYTENPVEYLILTNPNNPTGQYYSRSDIFHLLDWGIHSKTEIVIDESFVDFSDESINEDISLLNEEILQKYTNLTVIKSISKSYGIPGLRLGILATYNTSVIQRIRKMLPIWNINSFAEFFLQIISKYRDEYNDSLERFRSERARFFDELNSLKNLYVYPSQANFFMCELLNGLKADELAENMCRHNILIKDLAGKVNNGRHYIRLAIRIREENDFLIKSLVKEGI